VFSSPNIFSKVKGHTGFSNSNEMSNDILTMKNVKKQNALDSVGGGAIG
jgi:hypothetical protein